MFLQKMNMILYNCTISAINSLIQIDMQKGIIQGYEQMEIDFASDSMINPNTCLLLCAMFIRCLFAEIFQSIRSTRKLTTKFVHHQLFYVSLVVVMTQMHGENQLKKQTKTKIFYCSLERKNLFNYLHHHHKNSRKITSVA